MSSVNQRIPKKTTGSKPELPRSEVLQKPTTTVLPPTTTQSSVNIPTSRISSDTELSGLRNRELDSSLKELAANYRREKERQDRLVKFRKIQKLQQ
jgi:hypothetical protein